MRTRCSSQKGKTTEAREREGGREKEEEEKKQNKITKQHERKRERQRTAVGERRQIQAGKIKEETERLGEKRGIHYTPEKDESYR